MSINQNILKYFLMVTFISYYFFFKKGEYGKKFYMILKGSVLVLVPKKKNN